MSWLDSWFQRALILVAGVEKPDRPKLNFVAGATVVDNEDEDRLDITVAGTGGTPYDSNPEPLGTAAPGASTSFARGNHVHAHGNLAGGALHANAVSAGAAGFMSGTDKQAHDLAVAMLGDASVSADADSLVIRDALGEIAANGINAAGELLIDVSGGASVAQITAVDIVLAGNVGVTGTLKGSSLNRATSGSLSIGALPETTGVSIGHSATCTGVTLLASGLIEIIAATELTIDSGADGVMIGPANASGVGIGHGACGVITTASTHTVNAGTSSITTSPVCRQVASTAVQSYSPSIVYADAAGNTKCTETVANAYTRVHAAAVTSIAETWTQIASGAGGSRTRRAQQAAAGSVGGSILEFVGEGGTVGTNSPGNYDISLGTHGTDDFGRTGKFRLRRETTTPQLLDIYHSASTCRFDSAYPFQITTGGSWAGAYIVLTGSSAATLTLQSGAAEFDCQVSSAFDVITYAASLTVNCNLGNNHEVTLTGNVTTHTVSNLRDGAEFLIDIVQDATGGRTFVWDTEYVFATGVSNTIDATANARTRYRGMVRSGTIRIDDRKVF